MSGSALRVRVEALLRRRGAWFRRRRVLLPLAALALYAAAGFLLVPALVRHYVPAVVHEALGLQATLGRVRFNPFLFTLEANELRVQEADGVALGGFGRLFVDFELSSAFRGAWTFAALHLESAELELVREPDGRLNLERVLAALPPADAPSAQAGAPPRVRVLQAEMPGARLRYSDRTLTPAASADIGPMDLSIDEIATLPDHRGPYRLQAMLPGGARLAWSGQIGLHPLVSEGRLQLSGFEPRAVWDFLQPALRLQPPQGVVDATTDYSASLADGALALRLDALGLSVRGLALQRSDATAPMLALAEVELAGGRLDLAARTLAVGTLRIADGTLAARLDRAGVLDWSTLVVEGTAPPARSAGATPAVVPSPPQAPWRLEAGAVGIEGLRADVYDESRHAPLGFALLARRIGFGATVALEAERPRIGITGASAEIADIALSTGAGRAPLGRIAALAVEDAAIDLDAQQVQAARIALRGIETSIHREADGSIREVVLASAPDPAAPLPVTSAAAEWRLAAGEIALDGIDAAYQDAMTTPPIACAVRGGRILLRNVQTAGAAPVTVDATLPFAEGGTVALAGDVAGDGSTAALKIGIEGLAMLPLAPLVASQTTLVLQSGRLSAEGTLDYTAQAEAPPRVQAAGTLGIDGLLLTEAATGERLLAWRSLAATGVEFGLAPDRLQVQELRLVEPGAKIVVHKDRTTNLAQVMRAPDPAPGADGSADGGAAASFPVLVDRVRVNGGTVDFSDHALVLPFAARIERLDGVARGISSTDDSRATLKFGGRVGEFGEAEIDGQLTPFDPLRFTDIEVSFRNIGMSQLSPYSATFAGRAIAAGDLDLDLEYKVENSTLAGDNRLLLQDFRLGETVESPDAVDLPLDLAIALLTDAEGRIDLVLPVSGDVGDPQFSYGALVGKALGNLLRGIVTAPFRALGSLFGGEAGAEDLQAVRFKSGSAELMPRELERIATLSEALAARPQLGVELRPGIEPERDGYAARRLLVRRAHAAELGLGLEPGEDPGPVAYDGAKSQHALEKLLEARDGEDAVDAFAEDFAKRTGSQAERVNGALALLGRGAGDAAFYRELYLHLVNSTPEPGAELAALAAARTEAVREALLARGLSPDRVRIGADATLVQARPTGVLLALGLVPLG